MGVMVGELFVKLGADIRGFTNNLTTAQKYLDKAAAGFRKRAEDFRTVGIGLTAAGTGLAAGLYQAIDVASQFEKEMSNVQANSQATAKDFAALREVAIQLGADTSFSAKEAAQGIDEMVKAGISVSDVLGGGLKGALDLAAAGQMGVGDAAEIAASAMTQFALKGKDIPHIADLLAAGAGNAQGEVIDMGYALKYAGASAHSMGVPIEEAVGALTAMSAAGYAGDVAGTSLASMFQFLRAPTEKASAAMRKYNIDVWDANGNFIGVSATAEMFRKNLSGLTMEERNAAMSTIFKTGALKAANVLYENGAAGLEKWTKTVNDSGYATEVAKTKLDNLPGAIEYLKGALDSAYIAIGSTFTPSLKLLADALTGLVDKFNALPEPMKQMIAWGIALTSGFLLITGGAALLIAAWPFLLSGMASVLGVGATLLGWLGALLSPMGLVVMAIGGLIYAFTDWVSNSQQARDMVNDVWASIVGAIGSAIDAIMAVINYFSDDSTAAMVSTADDIYYTWESALLDIGEYFEWAFNAISDSLAVFSAFMRGDWDSMLDAFLALCVDFNMLTGNSFSELWDFLGGGWVNLSRNLGGIWGTLATDGQAIFQGFIRILTGDFTGFGDILIGVFYGAINIILAAINGLISMWNGLVFTVPVFDLGPLGQWGGFSLGVPQIAPYPYLAKGGDIMSGGMAMVGERGPELLNLPTGARVTPLSGGASAAGATYITINVNGGLIHEKDIWDIARRGGIKHRRSNLAGGLA